MVLSAVSGEDVLGSVPAAAGAGPEQVQPASPVSKSPD